MEAFAMVVAAASVVVAAHGLIRLRVLLQKTTLVAAWNWGVAAFVAWSITAVVAAVRATRAEVADQLWFASAVLAVSPLIAALGARRPGSRVWSVFIVVPLLIVLFLPSVTAWNRDGTPGRLHLEAPMLVGYGLVVVMGAGNYVGTRLTAPVLIAAAAMFGVLLSLASARTWFSIHPQATRLAATLAMAVAVWLAGWLARRPPQSTPIPLARVWSDFRDLFGIVWSRRMADRFNQAAQEEHWPLRVHSDGLSAVEAATTDGLPESHEAAMEQATRWLLRRFVDPEWIDARLR